MAAKTKPSGERSPVAHATAGAHVDAKEKPKQRVISDNPGAALALVHRARPPKRS